MSWNPWHDYTGLTLDRLACVADLIRAARDGAADDHRPEMYEGNWSLGVRCYERTCGALAWATQTHEWLSIITGSEGGPVHFVMSIGGHAVRFYHGSPDSVPQRYRHRSPPELQYALELDGHLPSDRSLRISIENDEHGRPESIWLIEIRNDTGNATNTFLIPLSSQGAVVPFGPASEPPANIPPVSAEPVDDEEHESSIKGTKTGSGDE